MAGLPADPNTPRMSLADGLASRFPQQAEEQTYGITGANTLQMQQLAGKLTQTGGPAPTSADVSQTGAQLATQGAQKAAQAGLNAGQLQSAAESQNIQAQQQAQARAQQQQQIGTQQLQQSLQSRLAKLSSTVQQSLVNEKMQFQSAQVGQGVLQATQLADWTATNAQSEQQLQDNMQTIQLAAQRKIDMAQMAYQKLSQYLQEIEAGKVQLMQGQSKADIQTAVNQAKLDFMHAQATKQGIMNAYAGGGTVIGAAAGALGGKPENAGENAKAGGAAGGGAGSLFGSAVTGGLPQIPGIS